MSPEAASQDPWAPTPSATHDEPSTSFDEISQPSIPDATDGLGNGAPSEALVSRPPDIPKSNADAAQTDNQSASVPADTSNSPSDEGPVTNENQAQQPEYGDPWVVLELEFDMRFLDRFDPLTRYDIAAIDRQLEENEWRILAFWKLGFNTQDLAFDLDTLLCSIPGVTEAELQAKIEQIKAHRS